MSSLNQKEGFETCIVLPLLAGASVVVAVVTGQGVVTFVEGCSLQR